MSNRRDIQFTYNPHNKLTLLDCSFIVDSTNGNGLGIRSLKDSGRISSVYMNTSASFTGTTHTGTNVVDSIADTSFLSPGMEVQTTDLPSGTKILAITSGTAITLTQAATTGHAGATITYQAAGNPNPAAGYIYVTLQDNYNRYLAGAAGFVAPVSGTPIPVTTGVTAGLAYVIVSLGTTTTQHWHDLGVPNNITPAVGVSFIAPNTATTTGTGAIEVPATAGSGIDHIEVIGDPNLMNSNGANVLGAGNGMQFVLACYHNGVRTAPANGTVIGLTFNMNNSAQGV